MLSLKDCLAKNGISKPAQASEPFDLVAHERRKAEWANQVPGDLPGPDCQICLNRGYIHTVDDQGRRSVRECECMTRRRNIKRLERSGLSEMVSRYTFGTWQTPERWQEIFRDKARRYVTEKNGWFLTSGQSGSGKTHLCTAICGALLAQGLDVRYMLWRDVAVEAKAVVNDDIAYARIVRPLKSVQVLYIDDLFKAGNGQTTVGDINLAFEILNSRYNDRRKLTIISTEWSTDGLLNIDEAVGSRIYERSKGYCLNFAGKANWRLRR